MSRQDRSIVKVHLSRQIAGYVSNSISVPWSAWKYFPVPFFRILVKTAIEHSQPTSTANAVVSPTTKYRLLKECLVISPSSRIQPKTMEVHFRIRATPSQRTLTMKGLADESVILLCCRPEPEASHHRNRCRNLGGTEVAVLLPGIH